MRALLIISAVMLLLTTGIITWGLIRGSIRAKMVQARQRDALSHAYLGLRQIQAYSDDAYAKNLADTTLSEMASLLGKTQELDSKEF